MDELQMAKSFLTHRKYDWKEEITGRNPWSGTRMPLSAITKKLRLRYNWRNVLPDKYLTDGVKALQVECHYDLHPAGKEILRLQSKRFGLDRSRFGTLGSWLMRSNERQRQIARLQYWKQLDRKGQLPLETIRTRFRDWFLGERLDEWKRLFEVLIDAVQENRRQGPERVFDLFNEYRQAQDKHNSSYMRGVSWKQVSMKDAERGAEAIEVTLETILKEGIWSQAAPNPKNFLAALRNRPVDSVSGGVGIWRKMMVSSNYTIGTMWRSRGALGVIPLSHVWAYAFNVKDDLVHSFLDRLIGGRIIFTPLTSDEFYRNYANRTKNGWYIFGDNLAYVEDGQERIVDIAMSEILQAYLRSGEKGENLCWFPHLTETDRQAPSGDPFTTLWNMEGDIGLIAIQEEDPGLFRDDLIGLDDIVEETNAFLGMARSDGKLLNMGVKLTVDSADKRIPVYLKPSGGLLHWTPGKVDLMRALQTVVSYGLHEEIDLKWWYDRIAPETQMISLDYLSADERIENGFKHTPGLVDELIDIIGQRKLENWWPHLEIDLMRRKINDGNEEESKPNGMEGTTEPS